MTSNGMFDPDVDPGFDPDFDPDVDLFAVRYVTGEMTAAESRAFEQRLADDQSARESVSRAVLVAAATRDVAPVVELAGVAQFAHVAGGSAAVTASRRFGWRLAAAAVLVAAAGFAIFWNRGEAKDPRSGLANRQAVAGGDGAAEVLIVRYNDLLGVTGGEAPDFEPIEREWVDPDLETPAWMVAALEAR